MKRLYLELTIESDLTVSQTVQLITERLDGLAKLKLIDVSKLTELQHQVTHGDGFGGG